MTKLDELFRLSHNALNVHAYAPDPYAVPAGTDQQRAFDRLAGRG